MRKYKDLNNTAYPRVPSANTVKLSTGAKNNLKYNAPGMPIGGIAIIYDKYHQIFDIFHSLLLLENDLSTLDDD